MSMRRKASKIQTKRFQALEAEQLPKLSETERISTTQHNRRYDLDNLRTFLTILVIIHHTAIPYGGLGSWKFRSKCCPSFSIILATVNAVNQTFFMGTFFFLSGWFSGRGISRGIKQGHGNRWQWPFIRSKLLRLMIPALMYTLFIHPLFDVLLELYGNEDSSPKHGLLEKWAILITVYSSHWKNFTGIRGPVWYNALLAVFDVLSSFVVPVLLTTRLKLSMLDSLWSRLGIWTVSIATSFFIRLVYPVGTTFRPLNLQPAFLPQYVLAYILGQISQPGQDPLTYLLFKQSRRPATHLIVSLILSMASLGLILYFATVVGHHEDILVVIESMAGGCNLPALLYAFWNETSFAFIMPSLFVVFSEYYNKPIQTKVWNGKIVDLARYSYAAFLVHTPISLTIELCLETTLNSSFIDRDILPVWLAPSLIALWIGVLNSFASWVTAFTLVEYVPKFGSIV